MIRLSLLVGFLKKEFKQTLRNPKMRILIFVTPVIQLIVFGIALSTDVKNIRLWAKYSPNDYVMQHIYEHCIASQWFLPVIANQNNDPFELIQSGQAEVVLIPPPGGLTKALGRGTAPLQVLIDATNVIRAQSIESYMQTISKKVVADDLKIVPEQSPITFVIRVLYNPTLETSYFMVPGVMCILISIITVILTSASITREKEMGTFEMLISAPISAMDVILGKTVPFVILGMSNALLVFLVSVLVFNVPMRGSLFVLFFASFVYVCSTVAIGTFISTLAQNQQQATLGGFLFLFPAILLSGLLFPLENMPTLMQWVSYCDPLAHFMSLLRNIMLKGGETQFIVFHVGILCVMAIIFVFISFKRFHTTLQ